MLQPVILSGGAGTRLWPLSTAARPKQFLQLVEERPMIVATVERLSGLDTASPIVVCGESHQALATAELPGARLILEPEGRNTAPAIAAAALTVDPDDVLLVLPSDHVIEDPVGFRAAVATAVDAAESGYLVTFGIVPTTPSTGFGYIRPGEPVDGVRLVEEFVEKPDASTARRFIDEGLLWNSGMFVFTARRYLEELGNHRPAMLSAVTVALEAGSLKLGEWAQVPSESVDHAVMEPTDRAAVIPLDVGWSDVGSWDSLAELSPSDGLGNHTLGDVVLDNVEGSYVRTTGPTVAVSGLDDIIVVATDEAVLIVPKGGSEQVRELTRRLRETEA